MGLLPVLNMTFGLIPLYGHDVWLHAGFAAMASYFGFGQEVKAIETRTIIGEPLNLGPALLLTDL